MINAELNDICERITRIETERKELATEIGDIKESAKSMGYDVSLIGKTVRMMLLTANKREAALMQLELFDTYLAAVGLLPDFEPEQQQATEPNPPASLVADGKVGEGTAVPSSPADVPYDPMTGELDPGPMPDFLKRKRGAVAA